MIKTIQASLIASTLCLSTPAFAETPDCSHTKHLAKQAFTMIQDGASLSKTINAFEKTDFNTYMIKKIYNNKNIFRNLTNAQKSAIRSCRSYT